MYYKRSPPIVFYSSRMQVVKSSFAEDLPKAGRTAGEYAEATAVCKARDVAAQMPDAELIIAADTVRSYSWYTTFNFCHLPCMYAVLFALAGLKDDACLQAVLS